LWTLKLSITEFTNDETKITPTRTSFSSGLRKQYQVEHWENSRLMTSQLLGHGRIHRWKVILVSSLVNSVIDNFNVHNSLSSQLYARSATIRNSGFQSWNVFASKDVPCQSRCHVIKRGCDRKLIISSFTPNVVRDYPFRQPPFDYFPHPRGSNSDHRISGPSGGERGM